MLKKVRFFQNLAQRENTNNKTEPWQQKKPFGHGNQVELHKLNSGQPIETKLNSEVYLEEALKFQSKISFKRQLTQRL